MKKYEFVLVLTEEAGKDDVSAKKLAQEIVSKVKGKIIETKVLGVRELAYPINKATKGWYGFFVVELTGEEISELEKNIKLEEKIIRYLLVRAE